jgi:hypothetical protein
MRQYWPGKSRKEVDILNKYLEIRSKMDKSTKLLAELFENPECTDEVLASPEFRELRKAIQERRSRIIELELEMASRGLNTDVYLRYVSAKKQ